MENKIADKEINIPERRTLKQSSFLTQIEEERNRRIAEMTSPRKKMSTSSFFTPNSEFTKGETHYPHALFKDNSKPHDNEGDNLKRARSLRLIPTQKGINQTDEKRIAQELKEDVVRLRLEEISFKIKTKISSLLKEISLSAPELNKFSTLTKIDDILSFFSLKIREKLTASQLAESSMNKARSRQKTILNEYQTEVDLLKRRIQQKETLEKSLKIKLKQANTELREVLQKLSLKEKDLSSRMTEIYQLKTTIKENEHTIGLVQDRLKALTKEATEDRNHLDNENQIIASSHKQIEEENSELNQKIGILEEELQVKEEKVSALTKINHQLNQELTRWRQRFDDYSNVEDEESRRSSMTKQQFIEAILPNQLKKSTMSMNDYVERSTTPRFSFTAIEMENLKLSSKVQELLIQNKQLSKDLQAYQLLQMRGQTSNMNDFSKVESDRVLEVQKVCKQKMETAAEEWKNKLIEIVNKYQDNLQELKQKIENQRLLIADKENEIKRLEQSKNQSEAALMRDKEELQKKVLSLTNVKYELQSNAIKLEKQIYQLLKTMKNSNKNSEKQLE